MQNQQLDKKLTWKKTCFHVRKSRRTLLTHSFSGQDVCYHWKRGKMCMGCWKFQDIPLKVNRKGSHLGACRGHHLDTAHGEEHPERGPVKSIFTVNLVSCGSHSWAQVVFQWIVDPGNFKQFLAFVFQEGSLNVCLCGWAFSFALLLSVISDVEINRNIGPVGSLWSNERT